MLDLIVIFFVRLSLVALFLPFSALDKVLNWHAAVEQAQGETQSRAWAGLLTGVGLFIEVVMSTAIITGLYDRPAAVILAGYCGLTALLFKQFWKTDDFRLSGPSKGRDVFWDFLKNFAVAGGFLLLATGGTAYGVQRFVRHPLSSSHPYASSTLSGDSAEAHPMDPANGVSP